MTDRSLPFVRCLKDKCEWTGRTYNLVFAPDSYKDACPKCSSVSLEYFDDAKGITLSPAPNKASGHVKNDDVMAMPDKGTTAYTGGGYGGSYQYERCYMKHKPLSLGGKLKIWGGSCIHPKKKNADIYIGFDRGMTYTEKSYPWMDGCELLFPIRDQGVPDSVEQFKKLVEWTAEQIKDGKSVHAGCIGGHGRTGLFFAALVAHMGVSKNATEYVRTKYCDRAVESVAQEKFLKKHFGVGKVKGKKKKKKKEKVAKPMVGFSDIDLAVGPLPSWDKTEGRF